MQSWACSLNYQSPNFPNQKLGWRRQGIWALSTELTIKQVLKKWELLIISDCNEFFMYLYLWLYYAFPEVKVYPIHLCVPSTGNTEKALKLCVSKKMLSTMLMTISFLNLDITCPVVGHIYHYINLMPRAIKPNPNDYSFSLWYIFCIIICRWLLQFFLLY